MNVIGVDLYIGIKGTEMSTIRTLDYDLTQDGYNSVVQEVSTILGDDNAQKEQLISELPNDSKLKTIVVTLEPNIKEKLMYYDIEYLADNEVKLYPEEGCAVVITLNAPIQFDDNQLQPGQILSYEPHPEDEEIMQSKKVSESTIIIRCYRGVRE
jgi:hypothetical protein